MLEEKNTIESNELESAENADTADTADVASKLLPEEVFYNLPEPLNNMVANFNSRERDIVFLSALGVISSCLPNVYTLYAKKRYSSNIYVFIIAPPASGKGSMNWSKILIDPIQSKVVSDSRQNISLQHRSVDVANSGAGLQIKVLPGNVSSARVYSHLENAHDSLLIFESEADSLSNMLSKEWGDFSDVMRKAFHHESISISRSTDNVYFEIKSPKLSIVLSGTPDQVKTLVSSKDNGLFSRFLFYHFDEVKRWEDVSPDAEEEDLEEIMNKSSECITELYWKLFERGDSLKISFTKPQWDRFQTAYSKATDAYLEAKKEKFVSVVKRYGLITVRIAMTFTVLRHKQFILEDTLEVYCTDEDMDRAIIITQTLLDHSLYVFDLYDKEAVFIPLNERILYNSLPFDFDKQTGLQYASECHIANRTFADILSRWIEKGIIEKVKHGNYKKKDFS